MSIRDTTDSSGAEDRDALMHRTGAAAEPRAIAIRILGVAIAEDLAAGAVFPAKGFQLIALLARTPAYRVTRKAAAALLWDSENDALGLTSLRQLLNRIRKALPQFADLLAADGQYVWLGGDRRHVDLLWLLDRLAAGTADAAALMEMRGDLLEGLGEATESFAQWLHRERAQLRDSYLSAASAHLAELTRYGHAKAADLDALSAVMLRIDPEREATYRALIEAYGRNGDYLSAEKFYRECETMLEREHSARPAPETAAVYRRMQSYRRDPAPAPTEPARQPNRPRVAFLAPTIAVADAQAGLLRVLIEDVANELARYRSFVTLAPHSSFQIDHDSGLPADNSVLRADYAIGGTLKPDGFGRVLALRMVRCDSGEIVWPGEFRVSDEQLYATSRNMVVRIASGLVDNLERDILERPQRGIQSEAFRHFLQGQELMRNCDLPKLRRARKAFEQAAAIERHFAPAFGRISQTLFLEWLMLGGDDPSLLLQARGQADAAIEREQNHAVGHWMKGVVTLYQRDYETSQERFAAAEILSPNSPDLLVEYADALSCLGQLDAAQERFDRSLEINPLPPDHYWWAGACISFLRNDYDLAIAQCGRMRSDEPVIRLLAASHALHGDREAAHGYARRVQEAYPGQDARALSALAPFRDAGFRSHIEQGLRQAGL
jgi:pentatricopeptide repeat protein